MDDDQIQELFRLRSSGLWTLTDLAEHFDTTIVEVRRILHHLDLR